MTTTMKRSWKLQDFMAHGASVNCLALGKKSGRVLATGGDDKKVNLWTLGKNTCLMSLSGHSTPVESVEFGHAEETLSAGCQSGSIKMWNLAEGKVQRTLNGHKSTITRVDFHPYGDHLCSGSLDSFIKLWDLRRKGCIYTYRGHSKSINSIKFSPDGQWIASGGEDGVVRIWDLRAGKRISDLKHHTAPVTDVVFHPHEFLLASSSADKTVNFWDLEKFSLLSTTEKNTSTIRRLIFSPNGECLLGGDNEGLKVYGWEPTRLYDSQPMPWGKVQDLAVHETQMIGASFHLTNTSIHVIDLSLVHPLGTPPPQYSSHTSSVPFSRNNSQRKSFTKQKPEAKAKIAVKTIEENIETDPEEETFATIGNVTDYSAIFRPHRSLNRSPNRSTPSSLHSDEDWIVSSSKTTSQGSSFLPPESPSLESTPPMSYSSTPPPFISRSSTPPLSPIRPQRKLSAHRPPSLILNMNPQDLSSPESELPPHKLSSDINISKLYISHPSRTSSPRRTPVSPGGYSSKNLETAGTSYSYTPTSDSPGVIPSSIHPSFTRKSIERDVDEHNSILPFGKDKPQVDFEVPTKENEDTRYYTPDQRDIQNQMYTPTKDITFSSSYNRDIDSNNRYFNQDNIDLRNQYNNRYLSQESINLQNQYSNNRDIDNTTNRYLSQDNIDTKSLLNNDNTKYTSSKEIDNHRYSSKESDTNRYLPKELETSRYLSKESETNRYLPKENVNTSNNSSNRFRDYFRNDQPQGSYTNSGGLHQDYGSYGPTSLFTTKNTDSGFSTLDSFSTSSPIGTIPRDYTSSTMSRDSRRSSSVEQIIPMNLSQPVGLDMEQFLPKSYSTNQAKTNMSETELFNTIFNGHEKMMAVLRNRQRSLNIVFAAINQKDVNSGVDRALSISDGTVTVDLLKSIIPRRNIWNLELCNVLIPVILDLLQSKYEMYITVACETLNLILRTFGPVIKNNMKWTSSSIGVDISKEERYKKCIKVYNALMPVKNCLIKKQTVPGKLGQTFRDLLSDIESIDL